MASHFRKLPTIFLQAHRLPTLICVWRILGLTAALNIEFQILYSTDKLSWNKMSLRNIAAAGIFAADRAISDYATNIWNLKSLKSEK